ncbi:MAG: hypothetical protein LAT51_11605 [Flavobacteriaceae bacterium]|nr:hypothetical protein [Flavobacteriaceae bacterium]
MKKATLIILILSLFLIPDLAQAFQGGLFDDQIGFDDQVNDVPESPINGLVFLGMVVASYLGFYKLNKLH